MGYGLTHLAEVIKGLSFVDMVELDTWEGWPELVDASMDMLLPKSLAAWATSFAPDFEEPVVVDVPTTPEPVQEVLAPEPAPIKEAVHLQVPAEAEFMFLGALIPAGKAEEFQRYLPEMDDVKYACDWVDKGEMANPKCLEVIALNMWDNFRG